MIGSVARAAKRFRAPDHALDHRAVEYAECARIAADEARAVALEVDREVSAAAIARRILAPAFAIGERRRALK